MKRVSTLAAVVALTLGTSAFAGPETVDFNSTQSHKGLGSFTGNAVYNDTTDELSLDITNTSAGRLTAFAFELEPGDKAKYEQASKLAVWKNEHNKKGQINARPFGKYEAGAAVNGNWGAVAARWGIAPGASREFVFDITGTNASTLTTSDFFNSAKPEIVASFAGFKHRKTDRAVGFGHVVDTNIITTDVVAPTAPTTPIFVVTPPATVIISPPKAPPPSGNTGGVSAVPLPPAAPAGLAMLGILGVVRVIRKARRMIV